jgi:ABC-type antimicrobial peptide transport system permease subunit
MLRAIGYRPWMVQWSFLLEASFVALLGILLGVGLGLVLARNFFYAEFARPGAIAEFSFGIPWATLGIVAAVAYGTSLLTTLLPSWQAARIYPAEALRYE